MHLILRLSVLPSMPSASVYKMATDITFILRYLYNIKEKLADAYFKIFGKEN